MNLWLVLAVNPYSLAILSKWSRLQDVIVLQMVYYSCLISDTKPLARDVRQGMFSRKESGDGEDGAVEQHLPQFEVNPVPEKKPFKGAKGQNEGEDVEREETRLDGYYLGPLRRHD